MFFFAFIIQLYFERNVDKMPPLIKCPSDIVAETVKGRNYAYVNWTIPKVTDNADASPILWTKPYIVLPWKVKIGTRIVMYIAQDANGNKARCKFKVKVLGKLYLYKYIFKNYVLEKYILREKIERSRSINS